MVSAEGSRTQSEVEQAVDAEAYLYLALMVLIGSGTSTAAKFAARELPIGLLPLMRFGVAGICLIPVIWRNAAFRRMLAESPGRLALTAAFCVPINQFFLLKGATLAPASHIALIYASCPLVVFFLACSLGQERFALKRLEGILATVLGVAVIGLGNLLHGGPEGRDAFHGDLFLVGAVTSWGAYLTVSKPIVARYGALPVLAGTFLVGTILDVPLALTTYGTWGSLTTASFSAWRGLAYLTVGVSLFALGFQNAALSRLDASQLAMFGNVAPVLAVFWGIWLLEEPVTTNLLVGGAMTVGGIVWTTWPTRVAPPAPLIVAEPKTEL
jgi:drug/metabolite transporter (DMT)-like permease